MKSISLKNHKIIGIVSLGLLTITYILVTNPSHDYEVDKSLIVQPSSYESCIKAAYGVIDETNEEERINDARSCLIAIDGKDFFVDSDGKALIFINTDEYYRISPDVIEKFKVRASALINKTEIFTTKNEKQSGI